MANYKVVDADQLDADMTEVADAIRAKGGTAEKLAWPDGYKEAVEAISSGGTEVETVTGLVDDASYAYSSAAGISGEEFYRYYQDQLGSWKRATTTGTMTVLKGSVLALVAPGSAYYKRNPNVVLSGGVEIILDYSPSLMLFLVTGDFTITLKPPAE